MRTDGMVCEKGSNPISVNLEASHTSQPGGKE